LPVTLTELTVSLLPLAGSERLAPELNVMGPLMDDEPDVVLRARVCDEAMAKLDEELIVAPVAIVMSGELEIEPLEPIVTAPALIVVLPV
jgi:hypothetical protein